MGKKNKIKDIIAISQPTSATVRADKKEIKILGLVSPELDDYASVLKLNPYVGSYKQKIDRYSIFIFSGLPCGSGINGF